MRDYTIAETQAFAESNLLCRMMEECNMPIRYAIEIVNNEGNIYSPDLVDMADKWLKNNLELPKELHKADVFADMGLDPFELPL